MAAPKSLNKVVLFCTGLTGVGGEERLLWEEEKFFREKGIETTVLTFSLDKSALYNYKPERLEVIKAGPFLLSRVLALRRKLQQINPDIVIASSNWNAARLYLATIFTSIPYVVHVHGTLFWFPEDTIDLLRYKIIKIAAFCILLSSSHIPSFCGSPLFALSQIIPQQV